MKGKATTVRTSLGWLALWLGLLGLLAVPALKPRADDDERHGSLSPALSSLGYGALAVGVPQEDLDVAMAGVVNVLYGRDSGLSFVGSQLWHQDSAGIRGISEEGDEFGAALAIIERPITKRVYLPLVLRRH
jgi:hypothetical protein